MKKFCIGADVWPGLSKLIEEMGEVQQVAGKIISLDGETDEHWDGTNVRTRLEEELGDLWAAIQFVINTNKLDGHRIWERSVTKRDIFDKWHKGGLDT